MPRSTSVRKRHSYRHPGSAVPTDAAAFDPLESARHALSWTFRLGETWWGRAAGTVVQAARSRLDSLVRFARSASPLYRDTYRDVVAGPVDLVGLPVVTRRALMARFDDWSTDRDVRLGAGSR